jgi:hypothetical protein
MKTYEIECTFTNRNLVFDVCHKTRGLSPCRVAALPYTDPWQPESVTLPPISMKLGKCFRKQAYGRLGLLSWRLRTVRGASCPRGVEWFPVVLTANSSSPTSS